jgi:hypothetical protein
MYVISQSSAQKNSEYAKSFSQNSGTRCGGRALAWIIDIDKKNYVYISTDWMHIPQGFFNMQQVLTALYESTQASTDHRSRVCGSPFYRAQILSAAFRGRTMKEPNCEGRFTQHQLNC